MPPRDRTSLAARFDRARSRALPGLCLALAAAGGIGCAGAQVRAKEKTPDVSAPPPQIVLTEDGERYLKNVYQFECANEYIPFADGEGPPVGPRTDAERRAREAELQECLRNRVAGVYTKPDTVDFMTWNGRSHSLSEVERKAIAQFGDAYLTKYVNGLIEREKRLESGASSAAVQGAATVPDTESGTTLD